VTAENNVELRALRREVQILAVPDMRERYEQIDLGT
jgi:hypothetical protein